MEIDFNFYYTYRPIIKYRYKLVPYDGKGYKRCKKCKCSAFCYDLVNQDGTVNSVLCNANTPRGAWLLSNAKALYSLCIQCRKSDGKSCLVKDETYKPAIIKIAKCSGCGREFDMDDLKFEQEEVYRESPGISAVPRTVFVRVKYQNIRLCKRCRIFRKISGYVGLFFIGIFAWLLYHLTSTYGKGLEVLFFLAWASGSFIWLGILMSKLFEIITRCDTTWTGSKSLIKGSERDIR